MEPAGLAVGVLGLAGLFSTCLDAIDRFESWKNFAGESQLIRTLLEGQRLLLQRWGREVGLDNGALLPDHHEALNDPKILSTIRMHLTEIEKICTDADGTFLPAGGTKAWQKSDAHSLRSRAQPHRSPLPESRRQKMKWALRDKEKFTVQAKTVMYLVQALRELVPLDGAKGRRPAQRETGTDALGRMDGSLPGRDPWTVEFKQILAKMEAATRKDVHAWLLGPHVPNGLYEDAVEARLNGTFDWVLTQPKFLDWTSPDFQAGAAKILWIHGAPGCGKTMLCARIVEHLRSSLDPPPAHFFFSFDNQESRRDPFVAVRWWLTQVLSHPAAFELVKEEWESQNGQTASRADVVKILRKIVRTVPRFTLVLDGLDECDGANQPWEADHTSVAKFLETIQQAVADTTTRILIVSRNVSEIRQAILRNEDVTCVEYKLSCDDVQQDIELYARSIVDKKLHNKDKTVKNDISLRLAGRCNGQFLWIKLQEPALRSSKNKKQLEASIDLSPAALNHLYERDWQKLLGLPPEESTRAICLLRWAAFALRPLTVAEITEALLINDACVDFPVDEMPDSIDQDYIDGEILSLCGSLVEIRSAPLEPIVGSQTVHLAHFSVKEFFVSKMLAGENIFVANERLRNSNEAAQNSTLAMMCLRYVTFRIVWFGQDQTPTQGVGYFLNYAAGSWFRHAIASKSNSNDLTQLTNAFFHEGSEMWYRWLNWYELRDTKLKEREAGSESTTATPLYYASQLCLTETVRFLTREQKCSVNEKAPSGMTALAVSCTKGAIEIVTTLLDAGADIAIADNKGCMPLSRAVQSGHINVVELLLENGASVTIANDEGRTPAHLAAANGHVDMVRLFLEKGADVTAADDRGLTALHSAAAKGHVDVVKLLIENRADFAAAADDRWTAIHVAAAKGHVDVVRLLLEKGADVAATDDNGLTALHVAAAQGHVDVVKLLIENGTDITAAVNSGWTPVIAAAIQGHIDMVKLLIENRADVTAADDDRWTALRAAAVQGHVDVVKLLIENGTDVTAAADDRWTALHVAAAKGHVDVVKLLLEKGAEVAAADDNGWTPLNITAEQGHIRIVELLLKNGADVNAAIVNRCTPLSSAAVKGHVDVVRLLLEKGADVTAADNHGLTPLHAAAANGDVDVVKLLLENEAQINATNVARCTPLSSAAVKGHVDVVRLLLEKGAEVAAADDNGWTPLNIAAEQGHVEVVKLLLENGANATAAENDGWTALHTAASIGHGEVVKLLLEKGAIVTAADSDGWTPLNAAAEQGHAEVVKLLLEKGGDVTAGTSNRWTPLHAAAMQGHVEVVKLLYKNGADVTAVTDIGVTPLHAAAQRGNVKVATLLLENGADDMATDRHGRTPLHLASQYGRLGVVKVLCQSANNKHP